MVQLSTGFVANYLHRVVRRMAVANAQDSKVAKPIDLVGC
jgi:hypothetical protein